MLTFTRMKRKWQFGRYTVDNILKDEPICQILRTLKSQILDICDVVNL